MRPIEKRSPGSLASLLLPRPVFSCSATQPLPEPNQSSGHRSPLGFATSLGHQSKSTSPEALRRQGARLPPVSVRFPPPECHHNKKFVLRRPKPSITDRPFRWPGDLGAKPTLPRASRRQTTPSQTGCYRLPANWKSAAGHADVVTWSPQTLTGHHRASSPPMHGAITRTMTSS
jgi:hypothetical protein